MEHSTATAAALRPHDHQVRQDRIGIHDWAARAAIAAPLVAIFSLVIGAPIYADELREAAATDRFKVATGSSLLVLLLLGVGLLALWRAQERTFGRGGHIAALVALVGTMLAVGSAWDQFFAVPWIAEEGPAVLDDGSSGWLLAGFFVSYLVFALGWGAFAIATLRARVLPRAGAITLLVGSVLAILPAPTAIRLLVLAVGAALLGRAARESMPGRA